MRRLVSLSLAPALLLAAAFPPGAHGAELTPSAGLAPAGPAAGGAFGAPSKGKVRRVRVIPPRRGGRVRPAWPARGRKAPSTTLARWLARQVGPAAPTPRKRTPRARATAASTPAVTFTPEAEPAPLSLVRSYDIPQDDPLVDRLRDRSWTYDSAMAAVAFMAAGEREQAERLLDQLQALQRTDGSLEIAYDTRTGAGVRAWRSGTMAWVGFAAAKHRLAYGSSRYDRLAYGAARWLLARQGSDGLLRGGPDATWVSTQHNIVAAFFGLTYAARPFTPASPSGSGLSPVLECVAEVNGQRLAVYGYNNPTASPVLDLWRGTNDNRFTGSTSFSGQPERFAPGRHVAVFSVPVSGGSAVWHLNGRTATASNGSRACGSGDVVPPAGTIQPPVPSPQDVVNQLHNRVSDAVVNTLLKNDLFPQGLGDPVQPLDVQSLGTMLLLLRGDTGRAKQVVDRMVKSHRVAGRSIALSKDPATYNASYEAKGPFVGFRPYADPGSPDVLQFEWTAQARLAMAMVGVKDAELDRSFDAWLALTKDDAAGPLGADRTVTTSSFNQFHVWPTSAAGSWALLSQTGKRLVG